MINEDELTRAIERTLVVHGKVPADQSRVIARMVLGYFGLEDAVLDNKLSSNDRDRFYQLEEEGLLTSEEEDATVSRGKTWRIHYWLLKKDGSATWASTARRPRRTRPTRSTDRSAIGSGPVPPTPSRARPPPAP